MKRTLFATTLLSAMAFGFAASAQGFLDMNQPLVGKEAGTFMIRARAIGLIPEDNSSSISKIGGNVTATAQAAPELDFSYFLTDHIALKPIQVEYIMTQIDAANGFGSHQNDVRYSAGVVFRFGQQ